MIIKKIFYLALVLITAQSCTIFSLNPLYHEKDLLEMPEIVGLWQDVDGDPEFVSFEPYTDSKYLFRYLEEVSGNPVMNPPRNNGLIAELAQLGQMDLDSVSFQAGLLKVGDHYFIDLYPYYEDSDKDEEYYLFRNFIPTHSFLKLDWEEDNIVLYLFSYDRLKELFEQNRIRIRHQIYDDYIVITATTDELQEFIKKYADDENVFDEPGKFVKIR